MPSFALVNILLQALASAPIADVEAMFRSNWNHPLVQDAQQGLAELSKLVNDIAGGPAIASDAPLTPSPVPEPIVDFSPNPSNPA